MKTQIVIAALAGLGISCAQAFTVSIANLTSASPSELPIVDGSGVPIPFGGGSLGVGYFPTLADADIPSANLGSLLSDFSQFGSQTSFGNGFGVDGFFDVSFDAPIPEGGDSPFVGQPIFILMGNRSTLADSSNYGVYKTSEQFEEEVGGAGAANFTITDDSGLLVGEVGGSVEVSGSNFDNTVQLVPEPSVALLGLLGGLGLLRRRR